MDGKTAEESKNEGEVGKEVQRQSNLAGELCQLVEALEVKLAPVVSPLPKQEANPEQTSVRVVALARQIEASNETVERCMKTLHQLLDHVEL